MHCCVRINKGFKMFLSAPKVTLFTSINFSIYSPQHLYIFFGLCFRLEALSWYLDLEKKGTVAQLRRGGHLSGINDHTAPALKGQTRSCLSCCCWGSVQLRAGKLQLCVCVKWQHPRVIKELKRTDMWSSPPFIYYRDLKICRFCIGHIDVSALGNAKFNQDWSSRYE